jgi:hypothetical protein
MVMRAYLLGYIMKPKLDILIHVIQSIEKAFCPTGDGGGVDPSCGASGAGSSSSGGMPSASEMKSSGIKMAASGQLKVTRPTSAAGALSQIRTMQKILDKRLKDVEDAAASESKAGRLELASLHTAHQMARVLGWAKQFSNKSVESQLIKLIAYIEQKYGIKADDNPSDGDPKLGE